jgi:hypothetical protein
MSFIESFGELATARARSGFNARGGGYSAELTLQDYDAMARELNKLDNELLREINKQYKQIAKGPQSEIKKAIPRAAPLRGMRKAVIPGRTTWGNVKPARSVLIRARRPKKLDARIAVPIVQLVVQSPATIIADMAGRGNSTGAQKVTPIYPYSRALSGYRSHRINGQGQAMINELDGWKSGASRMVYPAVEDSMDEVRSEMEDVISSAIVKVQKELDRKDGA